VAEEDQNQENDVKSEDENNNTTDGDDNANSNDALMEDAQVPHFPVVSRFRIFLMFPIFLNILYELTVLNDSFSNNG
jgi:hypothetical protein